MATGAVQTIMQQYMNQSPASHLRQTWERPEEAPGNDIIRIKSVALIPEDDGMNLPIDVRTTLTIKFEMWVMEEGLRLLTGLHLFAFGGEVVLDVMSPFTAVNKGLIEGQCTIPGNLLNDGSYYISLIVYSDSWDQLYHYQQCLTFDVDDYREPLMNFSGKWMGAIRPKLPVRLVQVTKEQEHNVSKPMV